MSNSKAPAPDDRKRTFVNKVTGEAGTVLQYSSETGGAKSVAHVECLPGGGPALHYHSSYVEIFKPSKGQLGLICNKETVHIGPGEQKTVPIGAVHRFFNDSTETVEFEVEIVPGQPGFEKGIIVLFGLANDGLTDKEGIPLNPIHGAVFGSMADVTFPGVKGFFINQMMTVLAAYGRWSGVEKELVDKYYYGAGFTD